MFRQIYLTGRFFWLFSILAIAFALSFFVQALFPLLQALFVLALAVFLLDGLLLFGRKKLIEAERQPPRVLSLGDQNKVALRVENTSELTLRIALLNELPMQFQVRDFLYQTQLPAGEEKTLTYELRPVTRGAYAFGKLNAFISTRIGLLSRRVRFPLETSVPVYPSIVQMKQYALRAFDRISVQKGIKKMRRIGHSYEFEQIKNYVRGDDYRSINWKASSRMAELMVNQYEDERAQQVYCILDKSRSMHMPFNGMSLLDYAVNASLVISNIALQKHDRVGLFTFSDKIGTTLKADSSPLQLNKILQALYAEKARSVEANYELLYQAVRKLLGRRSLLLLFANFESTYALDRVLPLLRRLHQRHLLVVIFFENSEIREYTEQSAETLAGIYEQTVARQFLEEKAQMVYKLRQYGIQSVLTPPEDLSVNTINKYLELKARGLI
jgi:uncharacterized protein (DUF58 family)